MKPRNSTLYLYIILGMLSAFGPFVTDFYLPALPELNSDFNTTPSMVQLSLTVCMVGLALGQLVVGPSATVTVGNVLYSLHCYSF